MPLADVCASLLWKLDKFTLEIRFKIKLISHHWSVSSSFNHECTRMNTNRRCSGHCVSRKSLNLATSCHADSSRRSCRQTEALRVGGSQTKADCRATRHRFIRRSTSPFRYTARAITLERSRKQMLNSQLANGANGMSDIEGKVAREAMSECGQRVSFKSFGV